MNRFRAESDLGSEGIGHLHHLPQPRTPERDEPEAETTNKRRVRRRKGRVALMITETEED